MVAALVLIASAASAEPVYRIRRWPVTVTQFVWDHAEVEIPLSQWRCNLEPGIPSSHSARMGDPLWADKDCEWTAEPGAWIFAEGAGGNYFGAYHYDLAVKPDPDGFWSEAIDRQPIGPLPATPIGFRITP